MKQKKEYIDRVQFAVDHARKLGADAAEAFVSDTQSVQINISNRKTEQANALCDAGIGIRILKDQKMVSGSSNDLGSDSVKALISDLSKKVLFHTVDEFNVIPGESNDVLVQDWSANADALSYDPKIDGVPVQEKINKAIRLETAGLDSSPKITGSMMVLYQDNTTHLYLANSNGISGWFPTSSCMGYVELSAAEKGDQQSGNYFQAKVNYDDLDTDLIGRRAAENALRMLGAKPINSCEIPMVVSPEVGTQILSYIVGMLSADEVQKGKSLFAGKLDTPVAARILNVIDDGKMKGGLNTNPVDGEGVPQQTTPLIVGGILKNYLYDSYTAKKGKAKSTGNYQRSGYQGSGSIGNTNLYLQKGGIKRKTLISGIDKGFYMQDAIGMFAGIDSTSGEFSIPAIGFMIEKGSITYPIRGISISGNLFDFLKSVDAIADDLTWFQSVGCPTFSVTSIKIGGVS